MAKLGSLGFDWGPLRAEGVSLSPLRANLGPEEPSRHLRAKWGHLRANYGLLKDKGSVYEPTEGL